MAPAIGRSIPIYIRNTFAPQNPCTLICAEPTSALTVKGITTIENIALINIEGAGMIGVPGTAHRLFGALREEDINVILISQGSSEHSICCAIPGKEAERAERVVRAAFTRETGGIHHDESMLMDLPFLAVVGDGMPASGGLGKVSTTRRPAAVNVRALRRAPPNANLGGVDGKRPRACADQ